MRPFPRSLAPIVLAVMLLCGALVAVIALQYSYDARSWAESGVGFVILLAAAAFVWVRRPQLDQSPGALFIGWVLGLLWLIEIGLNNLVAPPLPWRDILDDVFWAVIAAAILSLAVVSSYRANSLQRALSAGAWSGLVSGVLACAAALLMIVCGMGFILRDPLNVAEWAARGADSGAPSMAAYFAYETFAGAFLHLVVLGLGMGGLLGAIGGLLGKGLRLVSRLRPRA